MNWSSASKPTTPPYQNAREEQKKKYGVFFLSFSDSVSVFAVPNNGPHTQTQPWGTTKSILS